MYFWEFLYFGKPWWAKTSIFLDWLRKKLSEDVKQKSLSRWIPLFTMSIWRMEIVYGCMCKKTFCDFHAIGKCRVETLAAKIVSGVVFSGDEWGRHYSRPKETTEEAKERIQEQIKLNPHKKPLFTKRQ